MARKVRKLRRIDNMLIQFTYIKVTRNIAMSYYVGDEKEEQALIGFLRQSGWISGDDSCDEKVCTFSREGHMHDYGIQYEGPLLDELGKRGWERVDRRDAVDENGQDVIVYHMQRVVELTQVLE